MALTLGYDVTSSLLSTIYFALVSFSKLIPIVPSKALNY